MTAKIKTAATMSMAALAALSAHLVGSCVPRDRRRAGRASLPSLATASLCLVAFTIAALTAFALPPVCPALPPVAHDDTETVTNVPFAAWQDCVGKFKFSLTGRGLDASSESAEVRVLPDSLSIFLR